MTAAAIAITPLWVEQVLAHQERQRRRRENPLLPVEQEYRRLVGDIDARSRGLPSDRADSCVGARRRGASRETINSPNALRAQGLRVKAQRRRLCGYVGRVAVCTNTDCHGKFFAPFGCNTRFCPRCGPRLSARLFRQQAHRLRPVADSLLRRPGYLLAKLDLTTKKLDHMPTPDEIHEFDKCIKRLRAMLLAHLGLKPRDVGFGRAFEFGAANSNLHAHCLWVGPRLPRPKEKGTKKRQLLSLMWERACRGTIFEGSVIVSVKREFSFDRALGHCLKYGLKHTPADPQRAAELEAAFTGVRRFQCAGAFFNAPKIEGECKPDSGCPHCQSALDFSMCAFFPATVAARWNFVDLGQARRAKVLGGQPAASRGP